LLNLATVLNLRQVIKFICSSPQRLRNWKLTTTLFFFVDKAKNGLKETRSWL